MMTIEMKLLLQGYYDENLIPFLVEQLYESELKAIISYKEGDFSEFYKSITGVYPKNRLTEEIWEKNKGRIMTMARDMSIYRSQSGFCESQYVFPKGRPDDSEAFFLTAVREVEEETGIRVLFENPENSIKRLSKPRNHGSFYKEVSVDSVSTGDDSEPVSCYRFKHDTATKQQYWEHCRLIIPGLHQPDNVPLDGYLCKEYVTHSHSDMTGKLYKTTLWICVFDGEDGDDVMFNFSHAGENRETRLGRWILDLRRRFRVQELYLKCEATLNRYFPYLSI